MKSLSNISAYSNFFQGLLSKAYGAEIEISPSHIDFISPQMSLSGHVSNSSATLVGAILSVHYALGFKLYIASDEFRQSLQKNIPVLPLALVIYRLRDGHTVRL